MRVGRGRNQKLLGYMQEAVERLLERDGFENGWGFKKTQREALQAYAQFLKNEKLPPRERMEGYFDIATGVGKTAIFVALVSMANQIAEERGEEFRSVIVVPTNVLLKQTSDEFNDIASSTDGKIGFYGDGKRTLSKPITIMTYNAWANLSAEEKLSAQNVDLLVSDEAHRGTSEERTFISKIFNGVVRLAFTATPEFDPDKAVEHSHKHEIYSKPLPEAVRDGELASYIQSQLHIIRARPSKKLKDKFGGEEITGEVKRKLRQDAWTKWAVRFYREGRDKQTNDLVSDNQAGFFVDNINHAISLRKALNSDPVLKKKAKELGYKKGVAIDVHSRDLTKEERQKRIDDYKAGHYMAIIGDEMLKEGFDHKPMKTVIDWPHGSLVDKLQILGRGARKWFNKLKDRWEGLTFADTIVYVGSDDPEEDEWLRKQAIRKAVLASDILDGEAMVADPEFEIEQKKKRKKRGKDKEYPSVFMDDVEEYTTAGEIKTVMAERSELRREHYIEITDEMRKDFMKEKERAGVGSTALLQNTEKKVPDGLTTAVINHWSYADTANIDHWNWVMEAYRALPDIFKITQEKRSALEEEIKRTGMKAMALLNQCENVPEGLTVSMLRNWLSGEEQRADKDHYSWVIEAYKKLPDVLEITPEKQIILKQEIDRTGVGQTSLLSKRKDVPEGLNATLITAWISGNTKTANLEHWNWVMEGYRKLPDMFKITRDNIEELEKEIERTNITLENLMKGAESKPTDLSYRTVKRFLRNTDSTPIKRSEWNWIIEEYRKLSDVFKITPERQTALEREVERTGVKSTTLIKQAKNVPEGLNMDIIRHWLKSNCVANPKYWNWVIGEYRKLPDVFKITPEKRSALEQEVERTGVKANALISKASDVPDGLTAPMIKGWFNKTTIVKPIYWNWVISAYEALPDKSPKLKVGSRGMSPS